MLRTLRHGIAVFALTIGASSVALAKAPDSALEAFKARHQSVVKLVKVSAPARKIEAEVDGLLDYEWLAEASLGGKRYEKRCAPRCDEFKSLLTRLVRENYLKRLQVSDRGTVEYVGEERRPNASKVTTRVRFTRNGREQTMEIAYIMHMVGDKWQVRDIITDGVSLARNYRYQFNKIVREEGIDTLILRLQNKLAELAKKQ